MIVLDLRDEAARAPLDAGDTSDLTPEERASALGNWRDRMVSEHVSARVFAGLFDKLLRAGLPSRYLDLARAAMDEERSHAVLCARALTALGGEARAPLPDPLPRVVPHDDADEIEAVLRDALSIGACSETVAVALVGAEREQAATPDLRAAAMVRVRCRQGPATGRVRGPDPGRTGCRRRDRPTSAPCR